ncbi:hypothetical protein BofuT4_uP125790.1 [Botrytis cinerea T4]|uniref:Uncharacterized protein n=1 Tax=Botryotinia fuckeliana (strain T4) TaxID=999810 RepID=G2YSD3_BOTF4|nr:hypothetical protein BofuT4_uP125790.1 [Botrytis cinerea T4]
MYQSDMGGKVVTVGYAYCVPHAMVLSTETLRRYVAPSDGRQVLDPVVRTPYIKNTTIRQTPIHPCTQYKLLIAI